MAAKRAIYEPIWGYQRPAKRNKMGQPDLSVGGSRRATWGLRCSGWLVADHACLASMGIFDTFLDL